LDHFATDSGIVCPGEPWGLSPRCNAVASNQAASNGERRRRCCDDTSVTFDGAARRNSNVEAIEAIAVPVANSSGEHGSARSNYRGSAATAQKTTSQSKRLSSRPSDSLSFPSDAIPQSRSVAWQYLTNIARHPSKSPLYDLFFLFRLFWPLTPASCRCVVVVT
jgi:hypothetical protein